MRASHIGGLARIAKQEIRAIGFSGNRAEIGNVAQ